MYLLRSSLISLRGECKRHCLEPIAETVSHPRSQLYHPLDYRCRGCHATHEGPKTVAESSLASCGRNYTCSSIYTKGNIMVQGVSIQSWGRSAEEATAAPLPTMLLLLLGRHPIRSRPSLLVRIKVTLAESSESMTSSSSSMMSTTVVPSSSIAVLLLLHAVVDHLASLSKEGAHACGCETAAVPACELVACVACQAACRSANETRWKRQSNAQEFITGAAAQYSPIAIVPRPRSPPSMGLPCSSYCWGCWGCWGGCCCCW